MLHIQAQERYWGHSIFIVQLRFRAMDVEV